MPATIIVDDLGRVSCEIADASGEVFAYEMTVPASSVIAETAWVCTLRKQGGDEWYYVAELLTGRWHCSCKGFTFRRECKHCSAAKALRALAKLLAREVA